MVEYDVIFVGMGLANALIALRLQQVHPELNVLIIEAAQQVAGNHTWSFHRSDITEQQLSWLSPLIDYRWPGYRVRFPEHQRLLSSEYLTLTSDRLAQVITQRFANQCRLNSPVTEVTAHHIKLENGEQFFSHTVIDGRGFIADSSMSIGFQAFVGQVWRVARPHELDYPIIMDATVTQQQGFRFVYTLPLDSYHLLIEDTHYIDDAWLQPQQARENIIHYAQQQGWQLLEMIREEQGALPITLAGNHRAFLAQRNYPCSGLRAGLFHATTGYSLPSAMAVAEMIASLPNLSSEQVQQVITQFSQHQWRKQRFFRLLNRMLFLAAPANQRWYVMQRFYRLNAGLITRFYAGRLRYSDKIRILSGKPPVPLFAAIKAMLKRFKG